MDDHPLESLNAQEDQPSQVRSLRELIERVTGRDRSAPLPEEDAGLIAHTPYPFLALVGQIEMKLALLLGLINSAIGGVLLIGPRGTGKTTAVRSLVGLLPQVPRSLCFYGCMPEDVEIGGMDAVCPECVKKYLSNQPLAVMDDVRLVELPLNARLEDVIGGAAEHINGHEAPHIRKGLLAQADRNLLYIDEVNLLADEVVDIILDAASQGSYAVRRGPVAANFRSRFMLVGSMNPEEGSLRPQIMDRFGLRVLVSGLKENPDRLEAYRRVKAYLTHPLALINEYRLETEIAREEILAARERLPRTDIPDETALIGLDLINRLQIDSLRAEITLFEAGRAYAALDGRTEVLPADLMIVAPMALRMRRSAFISKYFTEQGTEEEEIVNLIKVVFSPPS